MIARSETTVAVMANSTELPGRLVPPVGAQGVVVFAHGSGSSRHSPRNLQVARELERRGLGTLLIDLLTPDEETTDLRTAEFRFDIPLLSRRVVGAVDWLAEQDATADRPLGCFGASTGAAAALFAAAKRPGRVQAVVSRGGRPDLAMAALPEVTAPTLLIVGGRDEPVIRMNLRALEQLRCEKELAIVPGATHLFEEPGTLEEVARLAGDWFARNLGGRDDG
jgi:putative phosphoribosyl transferase